MKSLALIAMLLVTSFSVTAQAQVATNRAPVVTMSNYVTSSSPLPNGGVVTTTYRPQTTASGPVTTLYPTQTGYPVANRVAYYQAPAAPVQVPANQAPTLQATPGTVTTTGPIQYVNPAIDPCTGLTVNRVNVAPLHQVNYAPISQPINTYRVPVVNTYRPALPRGMPQGVYVSQGLLGQPKAYVQGQGVRNFFRYILP